jgi:hypothetical protein
MGQHRDRAPRSTCLHPHPLPLTEARDAAAVVPPLAFSICTLVTDHAAYAAMREGFEAGGFTAPDAEYLYLDNSAGNRWDAFTGIPVLLAAARGRRIILCHQDIRLLEDGAAALSARLAELDRIAPCWALAGNAGRIADGGRRMRISDPHGEDRHLGPLPARMVSLDENFLVLRRDAPIGLSHGLSGFHLYGTDLCLQARLAGRSAWVIDFHLRHLSAGRVDAGFRAQQRRMEERYAAVLGAIGQVPTPSARLRIPRSAAGRWLRWIGWRLRG